ncbi:MAG: YbbR-like domain-containing protein [Bacillales bacterium]|nr:YbbR-like domain-containing protein [Bacillales bacterium]
MDRWIESPWVLRILALFLAILLYMSVNMEEVDLKKKTENIPNENIATIEDVPVDVYYDSENLVVSGVPQTVSVTVEGPKSIVQSTKALKDFKVYVDLSNVGLGTHDVPIKYDNISNQLKVKIEPAYAEVSIQEKVTKEFKVGAEISDGMLGDGYQVDSLSVSPKTVEITGAKDVIDQIEYVKATLDSNELIDGEFTGKARVRVLDGELNKLDVAVDPETVEVTVKVKNPNKKVPVSVNKTGSPPEGVSIKNIDIDPKEVTVYGKESALDKLNNVEINMDLSKIKGDTVKEVPIHLKEGLNYVSPQKVKVVVSVEKKTSR